MSRSLLVCCLLLIPQLNIQWNCLWRQVRLSHTLIYSTMMGVSKSQPEDTPQQEPMQRKPNFETAESRIKKSIWVVAYGLKTKRKKHLKTKFTRIIINNNSLLNMEKYKYGKCLCVVEMYVLYKYMANIHSFIFMFMFMRCWYESLSAVRFKWQLFWAGVWFGRFNNSSTIFRKKKETLCKLE